MKIAKQSWEDLGIALAVRLLGFLLALVLAGCGGSPGTRPQAVETVRGVRVETLRWENVPDEIEAPGSVAAAATAQVAARAMGTVTQVAVHEGDRVKRGQLLVLLDERELAARRNAARAALEEAAAAREEATRAVAAAQAQADVASKTYERFVFLRDQKSVSPQEFDEVEAKHRAALAGLEQAKARRQQAEAAHTRAEAEVRAAEAVAGYARVVAPFDGVVVRRMVETGSMVAPGVPLLIVENTSRYRMEVSVPASAASEATRLRKGTSARVRLDALPGRELAGKVVELEAGADPASQTLRVRIELPHDAGVRSGWFGRAWFRRGERRALVVPRSAVVERGQLRGVYAVDAGQVARWRLVTPGASLAERVEILSGLSEGERYVTDPGGQELDGKKVEAGR
ncbi:MAG: efflux RND transporter periplasmic adaptor subunit [Acidobacteria bacterium]|nr:efflux RND transporter periplasmic adaptor subunit [Acidobacteriota bacterium]